MSNLASIYNVIMIIVSYFIKILEYAIIIITKKYIIRNEIHERFDI